jgi:hypothetical protein
MRASLPTEPIPDSRTSLGIGESDWTFRTQFNITEREKAAKHVDLVFDGLDTYALVKLVSTPFRLIVCISPTFHPSSKNGSEILK